MKNIKLIIFILLFLITNSIPTFSQNPTQIRKAKLMELSFLIGNWEVKGGEKNSLGESFSQIGFWYCSFDMDSTVIRIDLKFTVTQSSGYYNSLPRKRNFTEYIVYNTTRNIYQTIDFDAGTVSSPNHLFVDVKNKMLKYYFSFYHPVRKVTIDAVSILKAISEDEYSHIQTLQAIETDFKEHYTSTLKKVQ